METTTIKFNTFSKKKMITDHSPFHTMVHAMKNNDFDTIEKLRSEGYEANYSRIKHSILDKFDDLVILKTLDTSNLNDVEFVILNYLKRENCKTETVMQIAKNYVNNKFFIALLENSKIDILKAYDDGTTEFSTNLIYLAENKIKTKITNLEMLKYLHSKGMALSQSILCNAVDYCNLDYVKWVFSRVKKSDFIVHCDKSIFDKNKRDNMCWLYRNNHIDDLYIQCAALIDGYIEDTKYWKRQENKEQELKYIKKLLSRDHYYNDVIVHYASKNEFTLFVNFKKFYPHQTARIVYYALKYDKWNLVSDKLVGKYNYDMIKTVLELGDDVEYVVSYMKDYPGDLCDSDSFNFNRDNYDFITSHIEEICKKLSIESMKKLIDNSSKCAGLVLPLLYKRGYKQKFYLLEDKLKHLSYNLYSDHMAKTNDIEFFDFMKNRNGVLDCMIMIIIVRYSSFEFIKYTFGNLVSYDKHMFDFTLEYALTFRDKEVVQYIHSLGIPFAEKSLFIAYRVNPKLADWLLSYDKYSIPFTMERCAVYISDRIKNAYYEWTILNKVKREKFTINDAIICGSIPFFKYIINEDNIEIGIDIINKVIEYSSSVKEYLIELGLFDPNLYQDHSR